MKSSHLIDDNFYMALAIDEAWKYWGLTYPNPSVGGLILDKYGKIVSISAHQQAGYPHSEVLAVRDAYLKITNDKNIVFYSKSEDIHKYLYKNHNNIFHGFTIYTTLEPCNHYGKTPPCSLLLKNLGFKRVVIGVSDNNQKASGGAEFLRKSGIETTILNSQKAKDLIQPFQMWSRERFIFFKYAQQLNGAIDGGTISSKKSREYVHSLRDKIDLMVIGGNTVRVDRPTLDSRLVNGKAPDILIFSKSGEFDRTIPLFSVPNRQVYIENSLKRVEDYNFIMVEGGYSLLNAISNQIDWLLLFISPTLTSSPQINIERINFRTVHQMKIGEDILLWLKRES